MVQLALFAYESPKLCDVRLGVVLKRPSEVNDARLHYGGVAIFGYGGTESVSFGDAGRATFLLSPGEPEKETTSVA